MMMRRILFLAFEKELITILIVNWNSSDFVRLNLYALNKLMNLRYKVIICNNFYSYTEDIKIKKVIKEYNNIELIDRIQSKMGSIGHGEALDILIKKVDTEYFVILDADNVFLYPGWDKLLIEEMENKSIAIYGTQASTSKTNKSKATDFPFMFGMIVNTKIFKSLNISMIPNKKYDTGGMMKEKYIAKGYKHRMLLYMSTRDSLNPVFKDIICAEYYHPLYHDRLICSHFGRGSSQGKAKYSKGIKKYLYLGFPFILTIKFEKEKNAWIKKCMNLIDSKS